jgi:hypothetical protein
MWQAVFNAHLQALFVFMPKEVPLDFGRPYFRAGQGGICPNALNHSCSVEAHIDLYR